jgi:hypothetical protein
MNCRDATAFSRLRCWSELIAGQDGARLESGLPYASNANQSFLPNVDMKVKP